MNKIIISIGLLFILMLAFAHPASAAERELVDKIAAVVGDQIILVSEVDFQMQMFMMQQKDQNLTPAAADSLRKLLLNQMIADKLMLVEAQKDTSIHATDEQVEAALQDKIEELRSRFPSEKEFEAQMRLEGLNLRELKAKFRREVKNQLIRDRYVSQFLSKVNVTTAEVRDFYDRYKDSLPSQPAAIKLAHILIPIEPSGATLDTALEKAKKVKKLLDEGGDFTTLAQLYSEDKGTASNGGDLGFFERGTFLKEFEDKAFSMKPGEISEPFKTNLGYHIIKIEDKLPDRIHARHILFITNPSQADEERALHLADSLRQLLVDGKADFTELVKEYSADEETKKEGGVLDWFAVDRLSPEFKTALQGLKVGDYSLPTKSEYGYHILQILERQDARAMNLQDDWDRLKDFARREKSDQVLQDWVEKAKQKIYVDVRLDEN
jgi:peptidyl-prolyl cis-trans isomerase SurA